MINDNETKSDDQTIQELEWQVAHLRRRYDEILEESRRLHLEIRRLNELLIGEDQ